MSFLISYSQHCKCCKLQYCCNRHRNKGMYHKLMSKCLKMFLMGKQLYMQFNIDNSQYCKQNMYSRRHQYKHNKLNYSFSTKSQHQYTEMLSRKPRMFLNFSHIQFYKLDNQLLSQCNRHNLHNMDHKCLQHYSDSILRRDILIHSCCCTDNIPCCMRCKCNYQQYKKHNQANKKIQKLK